MSTPIRTVHNFVTPEPWRQHYIDTGAAELDRAFDEAWQDRVGDVLIAALCGPTAQRQSTNRAGQGPRASQELSTRQGQGGGLQERHNPQRCRGQWES